ncbi:hypothetical protein [Cryobacterium sp. TMT1-66-1]|uniref:hypothetical protein n=1 Tax=Cryobacterium sp. TMT1-66-1 TaxID=1259242 RepID=UPI00106991A8|nr:hypothetical protein [Cryobacterium sp. TMT1-66-1]TFD04164.1 hypothetical protein E3T29_16045 [Cryobacterium sp. TMT1-66-1]
MNTTDQPTVSLYQIVTTTEVILVARNWVTGKSIVSPGEDLPYAIVDAVRMVPGEAASVTFVDVEDGDRPIPFTGGIVKTIDRLPYSGYDLSGK